MGMAPMSFLGIHFLYSRAVLLAAVKLLTKVQPSSLLLHLYCSCHRFSSAQVIKRLSAEEMEELAPRMLPGIVKVDRQRGCLLTPRVTSTRPPRYEKRLYSRSSKSILLFGINWRPILRRSPAVSAPHRSRSLSSSQLKLLTIYINRAEV
jgi:hypothetical protein